MSLTHGSLFSGIGGIPSTSDLSGRVSKQSGRSKSTGTPAESSKSIGRGSSGSPTSGNAGRTTSGPLTSSAADFPAQTSPLRENKEEYMKVGLVYGGKCCELLASYDPESSSWRTSQICFPGMGADGREHFSGAWPRAGLMLNGALYRLRTQERPTCGSGSSWLPTPVSCGRGNRSPRAGAAYRPSLQEMAERGMWPTPQAHDKHAGDAQRVGRFGTKHGGRNLNDEVQMWPTPRSSPNENRQTKLTPSQQAGTHGKGLAAEAGGQLNADWVSLLMGFPKDWLNVEDGNAECQE